MFKLDYYWNQEMHLPAWNLAVLEFNNYSRYSIDLWVLFLPIDGFAVRFYRRWLPVFNQEPNRIIWTSKTKKFPYFANHHKQAKVVRFGLKWFIDLSLSPATEEEILAVYESKQASAKREDSKLALHC